MSRAWNPVDLHMGEPGDESDTDSSQLYSTRSRPNQATEPGLHRNTVRDSRVRLDTSNDKDRCRSCGGAAILRGAGTGTWKHGCVEGSERRRWNLVNRGL